MDLKMETVRISETSAHFYQTTPRNEPEDTHLQGCSVFVGHLYYEEGRRLDVRRIYYFVQDSVARYREALWQ
jgi:hypothetical protein